MALQPKPAGVSSAGKNGTTTDAPGKKMDPTPPGVDAGNPRAVPEALPADAAPEQVDAEEEEAKEETTEPGIMGGAPGNELSAPHKPVRRRPALPYIDAAAVAAKSFEQLSRIE